MSANPLQKLLVTAIVVGFTTIAAGHGQFDRLITHAASNFAMSSASTMPAGDEIAVPRYVHDASYGMSGDF